MRAVTPAPYVRLTRRQDYLRVQSSTGRWRGHFLLLMVLAQPEDARASGARLGLTVSRRVGGAVVRNRVRRRLRALGQEFGPRLVVGADHVIVALPSAADAAFARLRQEFSWLMHQAGKQPHARFDTRRPSPRAASPSSSSTA